MILFNVCKITVAAGALLALGCAGKDAPEPMRGGAVLIERFTAHPPKVLPGQKVQLVAEFPAGQGEIDPQVGPVHPRVPVTVHPQEDTAYTLTVKVGGHSAQATVNVQVARPGSGD